MEKCVVELICSGEMIFWPEKLPPVVDLAGNRFHDRTTCQLPSSPPKIIVLCIKIGQRRQCCKNMFKCREYLEFMVEVICIGFVWLQLVWTMCIHEHEHVHAEPVQVLVAYDQCVTVPKMLNNTNTFPVPNIFDTVTGTFSVLTFSDNGSETFSDTKFYWYN